MTLKSFNEDQPIALWACLASTDDNPATRGVMLMGLERRFSKQTMEILSSINAVESGLDPIFGGRLPGETLPFPVSELIGRREEIEDMMVGQLPNCVTTYEQALPIQGYFQPGSEYVEEMTHLHPHDNPELFETLTLREILMQMLHPIPGTVVEVLVRVHPEAGMQDGYLDIDEKPAMRNFDTEETAPSVELETEEFEYRERT